MGHFLASAITRMQTIVGAGWFPNRLARNQGAIVYDPVRQRIPLTLPIFRRLDDMEGQLRGDFCR